ncbi:MAG: hypothetical protein ACUVV6_09055 [Thermoplasmatota archaeon]
MLRKQPRCGCHKRRERGRALLICDALLGLFVSVSAALVLVYIVLPALGAHPDLSVLTRVSMTGVYVSVLMVALNILWAVYYGCHKSAAGVVLSVATAFMVAHAYGLI